MRASTAALKSINCSATIVFNTVIGTAQLAVLPTARNSNLFPVKANGEVRLRSVLSSNTSGMRPISSFNAVLSSGVSLPALMLVSSSSRSDDSCEPMKALMMAGGASLAPKRWSLPTDAMAARTTSARLCNAASVLTKNVKKRKLVLGLLPGFKRLTPVLVPRDQLLCLPEPLSPG